MEELMWNKLQNCLSLNVYLQVFGDHLEPSFAWNIHFLYDGWLETKAEAWLKCECSDLMQAQLTDDRLEGKDVNISLQNEAFANLLGNIADRRDMKQRKNFSSWWDKALAKIVRIVKLFLRCINLYLINLTVQAQRLCTFCLVIDSIHKLGLQAASISQTYFFPHKFAFLLAWNEPLGKSSKVGLDIKLFLHVDLFVVWLHVAHLGRKLELKAIEVVIAESLVALDLTETIDFDELVWGLLEIEVELLWDSLLRLDGVLKFVVGFILMLW